MIKDGSVNFIRKGGIVPSLLVYDAVVDVDIFVNVVVVIDFVVVDHVVVVVAEFNIGK